MKRLIALLLTLAMLLTVTAAWAESMPGTLRVQVTYADGTPVIGARLTVRDTDGDEILLTADADGRCAVELPADAYSLRATDADGRCAVQTLLLDDDVDVTLVIRTLQVGSHATVATLTKPAGDFVAGLFGNNTTDIDIRAMLHGYATVAFDRNLSYGVNNTAVELESVAQSNGGDRMYRFRVKDGLTYNDGTPITAADYVFSVLLQSCPAMGEVGGTDAYTALVGHAGWADGTADAFVGVRLLDEQTFALNISRRYLPFYYELTYVNVTPYPMSVIAPGYGVADLGDGAFFTRNGAQAALTADVLRSTFTDPMNGYMSHPWISCGPYKLVNVDLDAGVVSMTANTAFLGNEEGARPIIEQVELVTMTSGDALAALADGRVDIINKVTDAEAINAGNDMVRDGDQQAVNYMRTGLGFLAFDCADGPMADVSVRQAIAYAMDRVTYTADYTGTYGFPVYSWYGLGQWMAVEHFSELETALETYPTDLAKSAALLNRAGYTANAQGARWSEGVRYRKLSAAEVRKYNAQPTHIIEAEEINGQLYMPLTFRLARLEGSRSAELLEEQLLTVLTELGFRVEEETVDQALMMDQYYHLAPRTCNAFLLGTNFSYVYDPTASFDITSMGFVNTTGIDSAALLKDAQNLRATKPGDTAGYSRRWLTLMKTYAEVLPALPIYSNMYFDFAAARIHDYEPNSSWSWANAILYTWVD